MQPPYYILRRLRLPALESLMIFHAAFMALYSFLFALFVYLLRATGRGFPTAIPPFDFLLLCLATFRVTELITCDSITRFMREPFLTRRKERKPDGETEEKVKPAGGGIRRTLGELIICPWCIGVWIGTLLAYFYLWTPGIARVFLLATSVAGGGIMFQLFTKWLDKISDR